MGLLRKFQQILPRSSLLTIYKTFIRSQLDYADIIYDQAYNSAFHDKLESVEYNHSHKKQKDSLERSLDRVLFAADPDNTTA